MPIFEVKSRSWESYVAGIGASGALMASAIVMFVILVGIVTFKTWPHSGGLFGGGGGDVTLSAPADLAPAPAPRSSLNLRKLLGAGLASPRRSSAHGRAGGIGDGLAPGDRVESPGGSGGSRGGQPQAAQPPSSSSGEPRNVVTDAVSGIGDTVQSDTQALGDTLGGSSSPGLGGVLGGVGRTLNNNLKSLAGE